MPKRDAVADLRLAASLAGSGARHRMQLGSMRLAVGTGYLSLPLDAHLPPSMEYLGCVLAGTSVHAPRAGFRLARAKGTYFSTAGACCCAGCMSVLKALELASAWRCIVC